MPQNQRSNQLFLLSTTMISVQNVKRNSKNSIELEYDFVRKDTKKEKSEVGVFKHLCVCTRGFKSSQGLGCHQLACETAKQEK